MAHTAKHLVLTLAAAALLSAPFADAAKFGGGKSSGMQRSAPSKSQPYNSTPPQQAPAPMYGKAAPGNGAPARQSSGPGIGTAVAAGVAGAAAGYMLGSAMSDNNSPNQANAAGQAPAQASGAPMPAQQAQAMTGAAPATPAPAGGGMPWGTLLLLAALLGGGLWWMMRRKSAPALGGGRGGQTARGNARDSLSQYTGSPRDNLGGSQPTGGGLFSQYNDAQPSPLASGRLPDGTEAPHFLRQAKATFLHLQSMNNPANVHEVAKYLTPEMFAAVKAEVSSNGETADFPTLNCDLVDAVMENGRYVASVRFHGMVSESVNAPLAPFSELWHYVKGADTDNKWLVAGIQQEG